MKEQVAIDFEKYQHSLKQIYMQRFQKQLIQGSSALAAGVLLFFVISGGFKLVGILLMFLGVGALVISVIHYQGITMEIVGAKEYWLANIENKDWESPESILYEDENNYYLSQDQKAVISKKGSRTMPSMIRGLSLVAGSNQLLWSRNQQVYIVYCDTVNIKPVDLQKANAKVMQGMKWQKIKNKVIRPAISIAITAIIIWYLLGRF